MVAKLRLLSALCALVAAVIVVWQANPAGPVAAAASRRSATLPMTDVSTTIKWPVVDTVDPDPFDPCRDIPLDVDPAHRPGLHAADARGQPALPLRRR